MPEHTERPSGADRPPFVSGEGQAPKEQAHEEKAHQSNLGGSSDFPSGWDEYWKRRFGQAEEGGAEPDDRARRTAILKAAIFNAVDPNERPFSQAEQEEIKALGESHQSFAERFEAAWNLKVLEMKIDSLAGKGDKRTEAEEEELNRCIVWYSIYRKIYREADARMREADQRFFNTPRSNKARSAPTQTFEDVRQQADQTAETA